MNLCPSEESPEFSSCFPQSRVLICILYQWDLLIDGNNVLISPGLFVFSFLRGWRVEIGSLYTGLNNETLLLKRILLKRGCVYYMCVCDVYECVPWSCSWRSETTLLVPGIELSL